MSRTFQIVAAILFVFIAFLQFSPSSDDAYLNYLQKFNKPIPGTAERLYRQKIF